MNGGQTAGTTTLFARHPTIDASAPSQISAAVLDARAMEERLQHSLNQGGLLVLTVEPRIALRAEAELLHRFGSDAQTPGLQRLSVDAILLRELRNQADALGVDWSTVLHADAAEPCSRDWRNLLSLVNRTVPVLKTALLESAAPLLVVNTGLLARYDLMHLVSELEANAGRPGRTPSAWMLLPSHQPGVAAIDSVPVPLVNASCVSPLAQAWLENVHRSLAGEANV